MSYAHITLPRLLLSLGLIVVAVVLSRRSRLGLERDLLWGALRGAAQLNLLLEQPLARGPVFG